MPLCLIRPLTSGLPTIVLGSHNFFIGKSGIDTTTRSPTEPSPVIGLKRENISLRRLSFSAIISETEISLSIVVPTIADFEQPLKC